MSCLTFPYGLCDDTGDLNVWSGKMSSIQLNLDAWIKKGIDAYKEGLAPLVIAGLIALVLSIVTVGILAGPLMAGLALMALAYVDNRDPKPQVGDVFAGFQVFVPALVVGLIGVGVSLISVVFAKIPFAGPILHVAVSVVIQPYLLVALFLVADRKRDIGSAINEAIAMVNANFVNLLTLALVSGILGGIGLIVCGIGIIATLPLGVCVAAAAWRDIYKVSDAATETR